MLGTLLSQSGLCCLGQAPKYMESGKSRVKWCGCGGVWCGGSVGGVSVGDDGWWGMGEETKGRDSEKHPP